MQFVAAVGGLVCIYEAQPEVVLRKLELDNVKKQIVGPFRVRPFGRVCTSSS